MFSRKCPKCFDEITYTNKYHCRNAEAKKVLCSKCRVNPFKGKKHSKETKEKISKSRSGKYTGSDNHMTKNNVYEIWIKKYGKEKADSLMKDCKKKHSENNKGENNAMFGKRISKSSEEKRLSSLKETLSKRSVEKKEEISKKIKEQQKRIYEQDPEKYIANRKKAAKISHNTQSKYKKNKIEKIVENQLKSRNMKFEYSVIMNGKQFDFGNKEKRILLEVQGDYWHANPKFYEKHNYTESQKRNTLRDIEKNKFAVQHNFNIYYIWENDILNNNFQVLDEIKLKHYEI